FGSGSRAPIAISLLVKNPRASQYGEIYFHDIGDYLSREEKLEKVANYASVAGIAEWNIISPDEHGDWLKQRDNSFDLFIPIGDKKNDNAVLFDNFSCGVQTNRDPWCYGFSRSNVIENLGRTIASYNCEVDRLKNELGGISKKARALLIDNFINTDPST